MFSPTVYIYILKAPEIQLGFDLGPSKRTRAKHTHNTSWIVQGSLVREDSPIPGDVGHAFVSKVLLQLFGPTFKVGFFTPSVCFKINHS